MFLLESLYLEVTPCGVDMEVRKTIDKQFNPNQLKYHVY